MREPTPVPPSAAEPPPRLTPEDRATSPGLLLSQIGRVATRWITDALDPLGLTPRSGAALLILRAHGPRSQQALCSEMEIDPATLVAHLNELETAGLISRRRDPQDRRRHIVEISPLGRRRRAEADKRVLAVERRLLATLDEDEHDTLRRLLLRVHAVTGGLGPTDSGAGPVAPSD